MFFHKINNGGVSIGARKRVNHDIKKAISEEGAQVTEKKFRIFPYGNYS